MNEWAIVEVLIAVTGFIGGFAAGSWKLSQYITKNTIITQSNNEKLTIIENQLNKMQEERYLERENYQNVFNEHERRINLSENNITLIFKQIEKINVFIEELRKKNN